MNASSAHSTDRRAPRWVVAVAAAGGLFYLVNGRWAMVSPTTFHAVVAPFDPINVHSLRDVGAFRIGLAAVLLTALLWRRNALATALIGTGVGSTAHVVSHVIDRGAGGRPAFDIASLALLAALLITAAAGNRSRKTHPRPPRG